MTTFLLHILTTLLLSVLKVVCLLVAIAYFTLAERKIMAAVQRRVGPNVVGPFGLLQPLADGLKLAGKELAIPAQASSRIFLTVAITVLLFALSGWSAIPFGMFDHSERMNASCIAKILLLTEPHTMSLQERWALVDAYREAYPRGGVAYVASWQAYVGYYIEEFHDKFDDNYYAELEKELPTDEEIAAGRNSQVQYLETHGYSPEAVARVENIREMLAAVLDAINKNIKSAVENYKK